MQQFEMMDEYGKYNFSPTLPHFDRPKSTDHTNHVESGVFHHTAELLDHEQAYGTSPNI